MLYNKKKDSIKSPSFFYVYGRYIKILFMTETINVVNMIFI